MCCVEDAIGRLSRAPLASPLPRKRFVTRPISSDLAWQERPRTAVTRRARRIRAFDGKELPRSLQDGSCATSCGLESRFPRTPLASHLPRKPFVTRPISSDLAWQERPRTAVTRRARRIRAFDGKGLPRSLQDGSCATSCGLESRNPRTPLASHLPRKPFVTRPISSDLAWQERPRTAVTRRARRIRAFDGKGLPRSLQDGSCATSCGLESRNPRTPLASHLPRKPFVTRPISSDLAWQERPRTAVTRRARRIRAFDGKGLPRSLQDGSCATSCGLESRNPRTPLASHLPRKPFVTRPISSDLAWQERPQTAVTRRARRIRAFDGKGLPRSLQDGSCAMDCGLESRFPRTPLASHLPRYRHVTRPIASDLAWQERSRTAVTRRARRIRAFDGKGLPRSLQDGGCAMDCGLESRFPRTPLASHLPRYRHVTRPFSSDLAWQERPRTAVTRRARRIRDSDGRGLPRSLQDGSWAVGVFR